MEALLQSKYILLITMVIIKAIYSFKQSRNIPLFPEMEPTMLDPSYLLFYKSPTMKLGVSRNRQIKDNKKFKQQVIIILLKQVWLDLDLSCSILLIFLLQKRLKYQIQVLMLNLHLNQ